MPNKEIVSAGEGDRVSWEDYKGKLLAIEPTSIESMSTKFSKGEKRDAVRADMHVVLNKEGTKGQTLKDVLIFPGVLISQTKGHLGEVVVGRLGQGVATDGNNPPWKLAEATPAQIGAVKSYLASRAVSSASTESGGSDDDWDETGASPEDPDAF